MELIGRGRHVVAVEPALPLRRVLMRKLAAADHGDRRGWCTGSSTSSLPDDSADLVVACSAFTPLPGHGGEAGLAEMERVCRPGGCVAIVWPNHLSSLAARLPARWLSRADAGWSSAVTPTWWSWLRSSTRSTLSPITAHQVIC